MPYWVAHRVPPQPRQARTARVVSVRWPLLFLPARPCQKLALPLVLFPRGSTCTTIMELGPQNHSRDGLSDSVPNSILVVYMNPLGSVFLKLWLLTPPRQSLRAARAKPTHAFRSVGATWNVPPAIDGLHPLILHGGNQLWFSRALYSDFVGLLKA